MELKVIRKDKTNKASIGELYIDNVLLCNTLEDVDRGLKQSDPLATIQATKKQDITAIPTGRYQVIIDMSTRFKRLLPHIIDVPGFEGIRIHPGNSDVNTDGCILLGTWDGKNSDWVSASQIAFGKFFPKLQEGLKEENVYINIV